MFFRTLKALRLNHKAASRADQVMECLAPSPGTTVADLGSGGGYFAFRFSDAVGPEGRVYAVDVDKAFLAIIAKEARRKGIRNIELLRSGPNGGALPAESCDLVFMRNVFHHFPFPGAYVRSLRSALRPGARVAVIDWLPREKGQLNRRHGSDPEAIIDAMTKAEYELAARYDFLPAQSFTIYTIDKRKSGDTAIAIN